MGSKSAIFSLPVQKYKELLFVTLMSALGAYFKVLCQSFSYVLDKALSGELFCTGTGLDMLASLVNPVALRTATWLFGVK